MQLQLDDRINYSIDNIERCIASDTDIYRTYTDEHKKALLVKKLAILDKYPLLKKMIDINYIYSYPFENVQNWGKIGIMPPEVVISDERIKDMCRYQFWTNFISRKTNQREWRFTRCPGIEKASACPYFSPPAQKVRELLDSSDIFIFAQTKPFADYGGVQWQYKVITQYCEDLEKILGEKAVVQRFGAGPCQICHPEGCLDNGDCRNPDKQVPALESMGIPVGQLCRDMSLLTGDKEWELTWIRRWGLETQFPKVWKVHFGVAVKLNGIKKA